MYCKTINFCQHLVHIPLSDNSTQRDNDKRKHIKTHIINV